MLFNSYAFLAFLAIVLLGYEMLRTAGSQRSALIWLALASLFFYGFWDPRYLILILTSVLFNYGMGRALYRARSPLGSGSGALLLCLGIAGNLAVLAYFKYLGLIAQTINLVVADPVNVPSIVLPLAISFFTFQQIAYLVDMRRGEVNSPDFVNYLVFVTFFPQLIAGPIVHHAEMMPQFRKGRERTQRSTDFAVGISLFVLGLAKKVLLADGVAPIADASFLAADGGDSPGALMAWMGLIAFTLQIYFDFSGYTDMAFGAARLFGIRLPANFYSPYKAGSIVEFWRRWHITLSRFLRDYLYIALGGNRRGRVRRYVNLMITMLLGGLWHGASVNFLFWGGIHGVMLCINHGWLHFLKRAGVNEVRHSPVYKAVAWMLTISGVMAAWVLFRAETLQGATLMLESLLKPGASTDLAAFYMTRFYDLDVLINAMLPTALNLKEVWQIGLYMDLALLAVGVFICLAMPNSMQLMARYTPSVTALPEAPSAATFVGLSWRPGAAWAVTLALLFVTCLLSLTRVDAFLYFQF